MATIEIKDFTKIIRKNKVLDNISLEMTSGKIYGFQGVNGIRYKLKVMQSI